MNTLKLSIASVFTIITQITLEPFPNEETREMFMFFTGKINKATLDIFPLSMKCQEEILKKYPYLKKLKDDYLPMFLEKTREVTSQKKLKKICKEFTQMLQKDFGETIDFVK